jgi:hypothetical protein
MRDYRGKSQFTEINHSKKSPKYGGIEIESNSQKSIIQIEQKMRGYRGKMQFTEINHSNRAQNTGLSGYKAFYRNQ